MKQFKYKTRKPAREPEPFGHAMRINDGEELSGFIGYDAASDIEERFYKALSKNEMIQGIEFRVPVISARNLPGQLEVDFVVQVGPQIYVFQVDGEYAHKGESKKADDARKDALVNEYYRQYGAQPVKRINGELLQSQEMANKIVKELI